MAAIVEPQNQYAVGSSRVQTLPTPGSTAGLVPVAATGHPEPTTRPSIPLPRFCATEVDYARSSCESLKLDWSSNGICRWKWGSVLTYNVLRTSFPNQEYLERALLALGTAAAQWNKVGVVIFQKVPDDRPAVFQLVYKQSGDFYARAFFPNAVSKKRKLRVYDLAFQKAPDFLSQIFCHELGHILGLRHEFADKLEIFSPCISYGPKDALSVMNNFGDDGLDKYKIGYLDQEWTRKFYACNGTLVGNFDSHFDRRHYLLRVSIREIEVLHLIAPEDQALVAH